MAQTQRKINNPVTFERLMRLGRIAFSEGDHKLAHQYWQQAAMIQPDNEEVWLDLLRVLTTENDRRVCLRNILTINPRNKRAQDMLDELMGAMQQSANRATTDVSPRAQQRIAIKQVVLRLLESIVMGALIAIGLLAARYLLF